MESDTLRKIQVKHGHGLTGSFKDRTIAEWLQVHNPTELDYQTVCVVHFAFSMFRTQSARHTYHHRLKLIYLPAFLFATFEHFRYY